jgi:hypothetical protein
MAIPAQNVTYFQQGPTASGQILADVTSSIGDLNLNFFATFLFRPLTYLRSPPPAAPRILALLAPTPIP